MSEGLVNRIRLEAKGKTKQDVTDALTRGSQFIAQSFGGSWYTDDDHPCVIQSTSEGHWGYLWLKRVVMK